MSNTLYTKGNCRACIATKRAFAKQGLVEGVDYQMVVLEEVENPDALREEIASKGFQQFPVIESVVGSWSGFNLEKVKELAEASKDASLVNAA